MKRKALIATALFCLAFFLAGAFMVSQVRTGTASLDMLIRLHQVEILREHLLFQTKTVQSGLKAKDTRFSEGPDTLIGQVRRMEAEAKECFSCHHSAAAKARLSDLHAHILRYEDAISRVMTVVGGPERLSREEDAAFLEGTVLLNELHELLEFTSQRLRHRTYEALAAIRRTNLVVYVLLGIGPLLAIGLSLMFVRSFARPVEVLLEGTQRLEAGDLGYRLEGLKDEFKAVGDSFNRMADSLKDQMTKMQRTEQLALCGEMAASLAHEIHNPLNAIKVSLRVLSEDMILSPDDRIAFERVNGEVDRIETLMGNLLDYARPPKPERKTVDVNEVIETAVMFSMHHRLAGRTGETAIEVRSVLDPHLPRTIADPKQLVQICLNLLINAVEAMPHGGVVTARSCLEADSIRVDIADTGPGVDEELRERIFEPFFTRKRNGTGLGLAITKRLIEQQGGSVSVAKGPEGGACFTVRLPVITQGELSVGL
ncbi:MAG: HAMP domain-containing protein [Deltaproteobacteria bacterium]|nr:HAMP domain-containing protein [Deltaproteobacteria bacterium]